MILLVLSKRLEPEPCAVAIACVLKAEVGKCCVDIAQAKEVLAEITSTRALVSALIQTFKEGAQVGHDLRISKQSLPTCKIGFSIATLTQGSDSVQTLEARNKSLALGLRKLSVLDKAQELCCLVTCIARFLERLSAIVADVLFEW